MPFKEHTVIELLKERIYNTDPTAEIILFGSRAKGIEHSESDWDILLLLNSSIVTRDMEKPYRNAIGEVMVETGEFISTFIFSKQDWELNFSSSPIYLNVKREGKKL